MTMRVLITGSNGFIGKNLMVRVGELAGYEAIGFDREDSLEDLAEQQKEIGCDYGAGI